MNTDNSNARENMTNKIKKAGIREVLQSFSRERDYFILRLLGGRDLGEGKEISQKE